MPVNVPKVSKNAKPAEDSGSSSSSTSASDARYEHLNSRMPVERCVTHKNNTSDYRQQRLGITHATAVRIMKAAMVKKATHDAFQEVSDECDRFLEYITARIVAYMDGANRKTVRESDIRKLASWSDMPLYL